jgi:hypothetical protein
VYLIKKYGVQKTHLLTGLNLRSLNRRRRNLEQRYKGSLNGPNSHKGTREYDYIEHEGILTHKMINGVVLIGGDNHYWPGEPSLMHRAFVKLCKDLKPDLVIMNGDVCDFGLISKHKRIGWERLPDPADELAVAQDRMAEIEKAAFRARKVWPLGNHDARFNSIIANNLPQLAKVVGTSLKDHFPLWEPCWRIDINDDLVVKHRGLGGKHDVYNTAMRSMVSVVMGHSHCPYVRAITGKNKTIYAVNHGMIADPDHPFALNYLEASPYKDWRDSFAVMTWKSGILMQPELVMRWDKNHIQFRGEIIKV